MFQLRVYATDRNDAPLSIELYPDYESATKEVGLDKGMVLIDNGNCFMSVNRDINLVTIISKAQR